MYLLEQDYISNWKRNIFLLKSQAICHPGLFSHYKQNSNSIKNNLKRFLLSFLKTLISEALWSADVSPKAKPHLFGCSEGRSRLYTHTIWLQDTFPFQRLREGAELPESLYLHPIPTDAHDKTCFLLETVISVPELAMVLNVLFVKFFTSETRIPLNKRSINKKSYLLFVCANPR